jgi:peptidylprolyl isomerase
MNQKVTDGTTVTVHYVGKLDNGSEFDNSYSRNTPIKFEIGQGQMLPGFESAVLNRVTDEKFSVKIPKAYGEYKKESIQKISVEQMKLPDDVPNGSQIQGTTPDGTQFLCVLIEVKDGMASLDLNHPLAGKDLNFDIEILKVEMTTPEETNTEEEVVESGEAKSDK